MNNAKPILLAAAIAATALGVLPVSAADTVATAKPNPNLELARQLNEAFVQVAEQVSPAVVVINVTQKAAAATHVFPNQGPDQSPDDEQDPMEQFKRFFRHGLEDTPDPGPTQGQGSGIIIRKDGYILTNRHVVDDAEKIIVRLKDGREFKGRVRGVDAPSDVAVVKIDATELPIASLADSSKTRVGEFAIAIGAPFALDYSVTFGHVSAKDRTNILPFDGETPAMSDQDFIQTDANINPGNSGGPLININGEVIGVNTLIRGLHTGIGFAIPSNLAREVADQLIADGKFSRAWLGIGIIALREAPDFRELIPGVQDGVMVRSIVPNGPASKFDLTPSDVITAVDGKPVVTSQQLKDEIRSKKVGQDVVLSVFRSGKDRKGGQIKVIVKPGEWEDQSLAANAKVAKPDAGMNSGLGIAVKALTRDTAEQFGVELTEGVIVAGVDKNGPGAQIGIKPGDIITSIGQQSVTNPKQFRDAVKNVDMKRGVMIKLISQGTPRVEILKEGGN